MKQNEVKKSTPKFTAGESVIVCVAILILGFIGGLNWPTFSANFLPYLGFQKTYTSDWSALDEVYSALVNNYDGEINRDELVEGAKKGLVAALGDQYTVYMTADEAKDFENSLHGEAGSGIGAEIGLRDGYVRVLRTLPNNPAEQAGILAGDIFYKIDGEEVYALSAEEIASKLRGATGTEVTVTVARNGEEKTFTMIRAAINNVSAYVNYDGNTAIITVTRFDEDTGLLVQKFANDFAAKNINKVILDLRGNGGGYVSAARDLLSLWLDGDKILVQKSGTSAQTTFAARGKAILKDMKTVVLINSSTASASEIVAGALQDYQKATIIGETTFGKGVVQTLRNLSKGTMLKVTNARWYTPNGTNVTATGITPDQIVEISYDDINHGRDPQLDAAKNL